VPGPPPKPQPPLLLRQVDNNHLVGMLSIRDVVKVVVGEHREQLSQLREYISGSY
jgi:CBS domain-containing protein